MRRRQAHMRTRRTDHAAVPGRAGTRALALPHTGHVPAFSLALIVALALFAALVIPAGVHAEEAGDASFSLRPVRYDPARPETESYYIYDAMPGQLIQDEMRLVNSGNAIGTARVYAVDATTGQTSGAIYLTIDDPRQAVGGWIAVDPAQPVIEVTLGPGEERVISFAVQVPQDAVAGQHLGGLVAENAELQTSAESGSALQVNVRTRTVVAVQVNLPGTPVEHLTITGLTSSVEQGYQLLLVGIHNDGNQMLKPSGTVDVRDAAGTLVQSIPLQFDTLLPDTEIQYPVAVPGQALAAGGYTANVTLSYATNASAVFTTSFEISNSQAAEVTGSVVQQTPPQLDPAGSAALSPSPVMLALGGVVAVLLLTVVLLVIRMRAMRPLPPAPAPIAPPMQQPPARPTTISRPAGPARFVSINARGDR